MPQAQRGEIWLIDLGMVQKPRPCLVLSISITNAPSSATFREPPLSGKPVLKFRIKHAVLMPELLTHKALAAFLS